MTDRNLHHDSVLASYRDAFAGRPDRPRSDWLASIQQQAIERFVEFGFPTRQHEEWRYTDLAPIAKQVFSPAPHSGDADLASLAGLLPNFSGGRMVFVDGHFFPQASHLPSDSAFEFDLLSRQQTPVQGSSLSHYGSLVGSKDNGFSALNTAFADDAAIVTLKRGQNSHAPLQIVFCSRADSMDNPPRASFPRVLIVAEPASQGVIVQDHVSLGSGVAFSSAVCEVVTEAQASLEMILVQRESDATFHIARQRIRQQRDSRFSLHTLNLGGAILRNDLDVVLADEGAACELSGLYLGTGKQLVDNHTQVDHAMPNCQSAELYKGILADHARGVFRGRVIVRPGAQGTSAQQQNRNLLLNCDAEVDTQPQLEIYADDVKCNHGSSIGQLDEESLFFLRSRGLDERAARTLLAMGFASQICQSISDERIRNWVDQLTSARLETLLRAGDAP